MTRLCLLVLGLLLLLPLVGGCSQQVMVQGKQEQLYAEAKGALESEGFRTMSTKSHILGSKGCSQAEGRLQFLYYSDTIAPAVVEVSISAPENSDETVAAASVGQHNIAVSAWSSLTYAPDPWITDLAMGVLRRAYLLSGNLR